MRTTHLVCSLILCCSIMSCARQAPDHEEQVSAPGNPLLAVKAGTHEKQSPEPVPQSDVPKAKDASKDQDEKYEAALSEALTLLADNKLPQALLALETAQTFQDNDFVRGEIEKLKARIDADAAAQKTVTNLENIIDQGKADDAVRIAQDALKEFGSTDSADKLIRLRLQAEALKSGQKAEEAEVRHQRFKVEADAALKDRNLRAASFALDQALQSKDDADLQAKLAEVRTALQKYDDGRQRAAQLRRMPEQFEDALAALQDAAQAWDTPQVHQEIDECTLALQKRRPRVSVADFEVRGDLGIPDGGRTVAEAVLPTLKPRFDLVERNQLGPILQELKLEGELGNDANGQRELGKLAKVQYLVVGSVTRTSGLLVQARLVDVRSGLIVQTAKVTAATPDELMPLLGELGKQLMMSDEEKQAYDEQQVQLARRITPPAAEDILPPVPEARTDDVPPPPEIPSTPIPPDQGGIEVATFKVLPPPAPGADWQAGSQIGGKGDLLVKHRLLHAAVHLGDNLFRRGRHQEAFAQYELALNLAPDNFDLRVRLTNCRGFLPPPPIILVEAPVIVMRPRVAVLNFATYGNPRTVPPYLSTWTPQQLSPYLLSRYDMADAGEVYWYMAKMGLTLRDLMEDPYARRWLGRALNVRYFLLGNIMETTSFDVNTYLIDAERGFLQGQGNIHVHNPAELNLRLGELAFQTMMTPDERARYLADTQRFQALVVQGQQCLDRRAFVEAVDAFDAALRIRSGNTEVQVYLTRARRLQQQQAFEEARRRQWLRQQAEAAERARRQWQCAQAAETINIRVSQAGVAIGIEVRQQAQARLVSQARFALKTQNFSLGISSFEGALALAPDDNLYRELAQARAEADRRAASAHAEREATLRRQREQEVIKAHAHLEAERQRSQALLQVQQKAQQERDRLAYQSAFDEGQRLMAKGQYQDAVIALQSARRMRKTDAVEAMLSLALVEQAKAAAKAKGEAERLDLERKLAQETQRRLQAEEQLKREREAYQTALQLAQKAQAAKKYDLAQIKYDEAGKLFKTDAVLTGLRHNEELRKQANAQAEVAKQKAIDQQERSARVQKFLSEGKTAMAGKQYDAAVHAFTQAKKIAPDDVEAMTNLTKAVHVRDQNLAQARQTAEQQDREKNFQRLLKAGQENLANKNYDAAVVNLTEAIHLNPKDASAQAALATAEKARAANAKSQEDFKQKAANYQKALNDGQVALAGKRFDDAVKAFTAAQTILPGDKASADLLKQAQNGKQEQAQNVAAAAKKHAEDLRRTADLQNHLKQAQSALSAKDLDAAARAIDKAVTLAPQDPAVQKAKTELETARKAAQHVVDQNAKRFKEHKALVATGQQALAAKRYDDAIKAFAAAKALVPGDKNSEDLLRTANKALADERVAQEKSVAAKQQQEQAAKVKQLVADSQAALKAKNFDAATRALDEAHKLAPQDLGVLQAQRDLDAARQTAKQNQSTYEQALQIGQKALSQKQFAEAVKAFTDAAATMPGDAKAGLLLTQAQQAWNEAKKVPDDPKKKVEEQRQAEFNRLIKEGNLALQGKRFVDAQKDFAEAMKLFPSDPGVLRGYQEATYQKEMQNAEAMDKQGKYAESIKSYQEALKVTPKDARASQGLQQASYHLHLQTGQNALHLKQYAEAVKAFTDAAATMPGDAKAGLLLKQAQQAWNDAKKGPADDPKKKVEEQRQAEFNRLIKEGNLALQAKRFADAQKDFADAMKLFPNDPGVLRGYNEATYQKEMQNAEAMDKQGKYAESIKSYQEALKVTPKDARATQGLQQASYHLHLQTGQNALNLKQYAEAVKAFTDAAALMPGDPQAGQLLKQAQQAWIDAKKGPADDPKKKLEEQRQAEFNRLIKEGNLALQGKRFADAQKDFADALKLFPKDPGVLRGYKEATYQKEIQNAEVMDKQGKYPEAINSYQEALKVAPKDARATQGLRQASYHLHLRDGQIHLNAGRFAEAVREFQAALDIMPGDPTAKKLLNKAKEMKK